MYDCFFFKQKTAYEMRISDWSSDVCSSDLRHFAPDDEADQGREGERKVAQRRQRRGLGQPEGMDGEEMRRAVDEAADDEEQPVEAARPSRTQHDHQHGDRKRVV